MQEKQNNIEPDLLKLISSNLSSKSGGYDDNSQNKLISLKNEFSFKDINNRINTNKKNINLNYNYINNRPKDPVIQKQIRTLKINEKEIMNELSKIMNNEKLLKNQSYLKLINNNPNNINLDKRKLESELKQLNENKNGCLARLDLIKSRLKSLEHKYVLSQGIFENEKQEKLQKFLDKQNRIINQSNDEINLKIKKLQKENKKLFKNMQNDIENRLMKKINEFDKNKEKETQNKILLLKKIREDERKEILKRKNKANEETKKINEFMNKKPNIKNYLYQKINNSFNEKIQKGLLKEKNKRKLIMKPMENDLNTMMKNYQKYKYKKNLELAEKTQKLKNSWSERNLLIPTYKTQLRHMLDIEEQNIKSQKENQKEKMKKMKNIQIKYSKKIENKQIYNKKQLNEKQKKEHGHDYILRNHINIKPPVIGNYNLSNYCDSIREKIFLKYNNKSQDFMEPNDNKDENEDKNLNGELEKSSKTKLPSLNKNKVMNLKKFSIEKDLDLKKENKTIDNGKLSKNNMKIKKTKKSESVEVDNINYKGTKDIKELIEKKGLDKSTFEVANCKLQSLNERRMQKSLLLKHEGGFIKNPSLGEEVCDILIDSMTAKLSLINEIDKIQKKANLVDVGIGPDNGEGLKNINDNKNNQLSIEEDEQNDYSSISKEEGEE